MATIESQPAQARGLDSVEAEIRHGSAYDALRYAVTIGAEQRGLSPEEVMRRLRQLANETGGRAERASPSGRAGGHRRQASRRRADAIYRTASKSSAAAVSSTRPLGGRDGPGCRDNACLSSSRSARPQAAASPTSAATMVNACVQSPTEPGVTMACSSLLGGVCRAEYGEVASVTCEGSPFFLGFNCAFAWLGESPGGRHGYSVGVALRRGWWQLRRPFMPSALSRQHRPCRTRSAGPVPGREDRRRARPDGTGPRSMLVLWRTWAHRARAGHRLRGPATLTDWCDP